MNIKYILLTAGVFAFAFVFAAISSISAQEMIPVVSGNVGSDAILGTSVDEIISAASSGGLSGVQDFPALKPDIKEQPLENPTPFDANVSGPDRLPVSRFNSDSLKDLEVKGGLSSDPQINTNTPSVFNLAVKFFEKVVFKKDVEFAGRPIFDDGLDISGKTTFDKDTAGYAIIKEGNQSVAVEFDHKYSESPVVTATISLQQYEDSDVRSLAEELIFITNVKYIITNVSKKGFEIMADKKVDSDIPFSWHALAVNDPTTSKKKGGTLKNKINPESISNNSSASSSIRDRANSDSDAESSSASSLAPQASQTSSDPNAASTNTSN